MKLSIKRALLSALCGLCVVTVNGLDPVSAADPNANTSTIQVEAKRFSFQPDHITVKRGTSVRLKIRSDDVAHGLSIKPLNLAIDIPKGKTAEVAFVPEQVGTFEGKCSHFCGVGHGSMRFTVKVVP